MLRLACLPLFVKCFSLSWCCPLCGSFTPTSDNKAIGLEHCFFRAVLCKLLRWWCMKIPVDQQFVKRTDQPICHQRPCCVQSRWTQVPECIFADIKWRQGQWAWSQCCCCYVIKFKRLCRCPVCVQICCEQAFDISTTHLISFASSFSPGTFLRGSWTAQRQKQLVRFLSKFRVQVNTNIRQLLEATGR